MPEYVPQLSSADFASFASLSYQELALRLMAPFVGGDIPEEDLARLINEAYGSFDHEAITPLTQIAPGEWIVELFHGPSLSFKDVALQLIGPLFEYLLTMRGERVTIVGATSGDTGSAAIEAIKGRDEADIFILFPEGRISEVQRRQMTTVAANNIHVIGVEGTFDDCQAALKAMFADAAFRKEVNLSAVNSINWARIMAQLVYYVYVGLHLGAPATAVLFSVPTGNFGDVYGGHLASKMGLPVEGFVIATNVNDILARTFNTGSYAMEAVQATQSPAMDIQISSNFERLLFDIYDRDGAVITDFYEELARKGSFQADLQRIRQVAPLFSASRVTESETLATMRDVYESTGMFIDPHTAVGLNAGRKHHALCPGVPLVSLSTAHAAKFPEAVEAATGRKPPVPDRLQAVMGADERYEVLPNDLAVLKSYIRERR